MPVDPFLEPILPTLVDQTDVSDYPAWRAEVNRQGDLLFGRMGEPGPAVRVRQAFTLPVEGGTVDLLVYQPFGPGPHPAHLFLHGGGWSQGTIHGAFIDAACRERCIGADCVVVSVDYRKAPEHPYPTGLNDCSSALVWLSEHAEELGVRPDLITVGGQSAGGNLAAALALKVRDEGGPALAFQLLEVPALDLTFSQPSHRRLGTGYGLSSTTLHLVRRDYLTNPDQAGEPYVSPLLAPDLSRLPAAHLMTAEYDPLRDDGEAYAGRLAEAGVPVTWTLGAGHIHGSSAFTATMASARAWRAEVLRVLRRAHGVPDRSDALGAVTA